MTETSVRISKDHKDLIEEVADQLDTSIKSVVGMILTWFFDTDWGNPDVITRLLEDDEDDDDDVEGPDIIGEFLGFDEEEG